MTGSTHPVIRVADSYLVLCASRGGVVSIAPGLVWVYVHD